MLDSAILIAIVDDEEPVRIAMSRLCRAYGLTPQTFSSGLQLFASILDGPRPDCLILDMQMPGCTGLDIQTWLRERHIDIPVVIITGREDGQIRARSLVLGAFAFLYKPVDGGVLMAAVQDAVNERALTASGSRSSSPSPASSL